MSLTLNTQLLLKELPVALELMRPTQARHESIWLLLYLLVPLPPCSTFPLCFRLSLAACSISPGSLQRKLAKWEAELRNRGA